MSREMTNIEYRRITDEKEHNDLMLIFQLQEPRFAHYKEFGLSQTYFIGEVRYVLMWYEAKPQIDVVLKESEYV